MHPTFSFHISWFDLRRGIGVALSIALFALWVLLELSSAAPQVARVRGPARWVTAQTFGAAWPFTVDAGTVRCREWKIITFTAPDGSSYALNAGAQAGRDPQLAQLASIRRADPAAPAQLVPLTAIEALGERLCRGGDD
jgi:hypothetical protein